MPEPRAILRHLVLSIAFVLVFLLLNRPEVIVIARLGAVVWYPATGLVLALILGISPWYALLAGFAGALAGVLIYDQPLTTFSETIGAVAVGFYAAAAYALRGPLQIDLKLHRRRDVILYLSVTTAAAVLSTGVGCGLPGRRSRHPLERILAVRFDVVPRRRDRFVGSRPLSSHPRVSMGTSATVARAAPS
jgi:hypothetical protein